MRLAWRIAAGPNRAPGRFEVPRSNGMPAMQIAASLRECSMPRKLGRVAKVGTVLMSLIWETRSRPSSPGSQLQRLFVKQARGNRIGRQLGVTAEGSAWLETPALLE